MARSAVALLLAAALLAACGDDESAGSRDCSADPPSSSGWTGTAEADTSTGMADVAPFNRFLETAAPPVSTSPCDAARVFLHLDRPSEEGITVDVATQPPVAGITSVTVTRDHLPDDSVRAERWVLAFQEQSDGTVRLVTARASYRCQPGRGHQDFSVELCV